MPSTKVSTNDCGTYLRQHGETKRVTVTSPSITVKLSYLGFVKEKRKKRLCPRPT